jgi:hypothetical protein
VDNLLSVPVDTPALAYVPIMYMGTTGLNDNRFFVINRIGCYDTPGLSASIQIHDFVIHEWQVSGWELNESQSGHPFGKCTQVWESLLQNLMRVERTTGEQAHGIYIFDVEHLHFEPTHIYSVMESLRLVTDMIFINYPELLHKIVVVNCPPVFNLLYKMTRSFLPKRSAVSRMICDIFSTDFFQEKIVMTGNDWRERLVEYVAPKYLPVYYGGELNENRVNKKY